MDLSSILSMLKALVPVLEPIGEQGINQVWAQVDAQIASLSDSSDWKTLLQSLSPAIKQFIILELKKL